MILWKLLKLLNILKFYQKELLKKWKWNKRIKRRILWMLLGTLGTSLLGNMLTGKGILRASYGNKEGKGILKLVMHLTLIFNSTSSFD